MLLSIQNLLGNRKGAVLCMESGIIKSSFSQIKHRMLTVSEYGYHIQINVLLVRFDVL